MTHQARESGGAIEPIPVVGIGIMQEITAVAASATVWFLAVGPNPDASSGNRMALAPDTGYHVKVTAGVDKIAAWDGSAGGATANKVGPNTTVVYVYYDSTAGTAYATEMV